MPIVSEQYELVIGVDTHAANHALSVVTTATGARLTRQAFLPARPDWITPEHGSPVGLVNGPLLWLSRASAPTAPSWPSVCSRPGWPWWSPPR